ncbi:MAG: proton-conducting membrane transporter [Clostridia bacterium]|jgi:multicomponent Na+:H+ antiporter subunit D|nr:proton-conducting membrane transporter [Clostridia bacterium]
MSIPLWAPILIPVFFGILTYTLPEKIKKIVAIVGAGTTLVVCVMIFAQTTSGPMSLSLGGWDPPVGIMLFADRISSVLITLTSLLFFSLTIFEFGKKHSKRTFYMLFLILNGLLNGLFLVDDLFSIFVLIEVSTIVVALLIMYKRDSRSMYDGLIYLLVNIFSATFFLFGLAMLYKQTGTFSLSLLGDIITQDMPALYLPFAFIMTSVCLKAALMPLFSWLPRAHGTPSSPSVVSAILSGLYVKSGIYLFLRCQNAFSAIDTQTFFLIAGIITAIIGFVFAIAQSDIKMILSYGTVSQLGLIMIALNTGSETAMWGGVYHIINHAIFKSMLFVGAGEIIAEYKTRNIYEMKGVFKRMPLISAAMIAAILGITGAPLFNGSISKYLISQGSNDLVGDIMLTLINLGTIVLFIKLSRIFAGNTGVKARVPANRAAVCVFLGATCLVLGIFGAPIIEFLFGIQVKIDTAGYIQKSIIFAASVVGAWLIYRFAVRDRAFWKRVRAFDLGFNKIAMSIVLFFVVFTAYLYFG